ncbi:hypothetical protein HGA88_05610 [Candidatus Roizmanbacteria bacterium]|nr:hypothetical protein [Candidatus Roizmanbacteria bacterium]
METPVSTPVIEVPREEPVPIELSQYSEALVQCVSSIKPKRRPDDISKLTVSQTVSFLALTYEKVRNAVEFREEHLIRRAAVDRMLRRRLALNPEGKGEAENLLRELMWARYFENGMLGESDISTIQKLIDLYLDIKKQVLEHVSSSHKAVLSRFIFDLLTCEIEETLNPAETARNSCITFFIYQTMRQKIRIEGMEDEQKDAFFFVALEKAFRKSDLPFQRYHLFTLYYQPLSQYSEEERKEIVEKLPAIAKKIDEMIQNPLIDKLSKFTRKQLPPFLVLSELVKEKPASLRAIITRKELLIQEVNRICKEKYDQTQKRLQTLAFKSLVYIFATKMVLALILEYPLSILFFGEVSWFSIGVNTLFPPTLMMIILMFIKLPGEDNTIRIGQRLTEIIDNDQSFETSVALITKKPKARGKKRQVVFTVLYSVVFIVVLYLIHEALSILHFNAISQAIFIFFVSVISFFAYRIKEVSKEYRLVERDGFFTPLVDLLFIPVLSLGKFFSQELARFNFFIVFFDFIIEAPFKLIIEVIEEWISFIRARKEEIV